MSAEQGAGGAAAERPSFRRILVPLDGSELAEAILPHILSLAKRYRSAVTLLRAYLPSASLLAAEAATAVPGAGPMVDPGMYAEMGRGEALAYLELVADRLSAQGVAVDHRRPEGHPGGAIVDEARRLPADLIAMTTHGRGGLGRLVLGSVADHVLRHAPCPVLLVRVAS